MRAEIAQIYSETEKNKSETEKNRSENRIHHIRIYLFFAALVAVIVLAATGNLDMIPEFVGWWKDLFGAV